MYAGCAQVLREPSRFSKQHLPESRLSFQSEAQEESQHFLRGRDFGETQALPSYATGFLGGIVLCILQLSKGETFVRFTGSSS